MTETVFSENVVTYRDADGAEREMVSIDMPWQGSRGSLRAAAGTKEGVESMLDTMERAHAS